ncbi:zinc finger protein 64-like [Diabrotica virgifera virgifera]|uniref:C2H2-type domain-containing protein n=1 Tax=Diabrotica virgifera virgifera TaxID=50390 RepID=A0ABM5JJJ0_DIAVI|nr:zinc finger protein 64-like [Diabrotica virgifera virgifera]
MYTTFSSHPFPSLSLPLMYTSKEEIVKEMADLKMTINQMAHKIEKLGTNEKPNKTPPQTIKKSISTQTDPAETQESLVSSPSKVNTVPPTKYTVKENWHYVVVSKIPPPYTAKQIAHYVKEKLGTTDFIRCFSLLRDTDRPDSDFKIGVQNQSFIKLLKDPSLWPPGTVVHNLNDNPPAHANSASTTIKVAAPASSTPYTTPSTRTKEGISIQIGSDRDAIIASLRQNEVQTESQGSLITQTRESSYKCETCLKEFTVLRYSKRHLQIHTGNKPYKCEICFKQFGKAEALKGHLRIHTGEKSYKCEICYKQFRQDGHLKRHVKIHTDEKPLSVKFVLRNLVKQEI